MGEELGTCYWFFICIWRHKRRRKLTIYGTIGNVFERLFYNTRVPACVQCVIQSLKIFFLGKDY